MDWLSHLFFTILLFSPFTTIAKTTKTKCLEHQQTLLLEMRKQLVFNSSLSTKLVQWNEADDCCRWEGVECDGGGRVVSLLLQSEGVSGGLDESSSLFGLEYLEVLDLSNNVFNESQIPREFYKLTHLTSLDLSSCSLKGYFPEIIFHLPSLQFLDLSNNPLLHGSIPQFSQNTSFQSIVLSDTSFSGSLPAHSISDLQSLSYLDLSHCKFSGPIPHTLGNLTRLVNVDLSFNFFTGSISSIHFESLSNVIQIDLSENSLSGTIPISVFALPSLEVLVLSGNQFGGQVAELPIVNMSTQLLSLDFSSNRLEGPIPTSSLFNLKNLVYLDLSVNGFSNTFQLEKILNLPTLEYLVLSSNNLSLDESTAMSPAAVKESSLSFLDLSNNKIGGEIPSWIWDIEPLSNLNLSCNMLVGLQKPYNPAVPISLDFLDLHSNQLPGEFPSSLIQRVRYADLSNNSLSGSFPSYICSNRDLIFLDLSSNNLSGSIPDCLFKNVISLRVLNLGRNRISGPIPNTFSVYSLLKSLDLSDNNLVGNVPLSLANSSRLDVLNLSGNKLSGKIPTNLDNLTVINLGRNNMRGPIPNFTAHCSLQYLVLNDNNFIGEVPQSLGNCKQLEVMNVGNNHVEGSFPCMLPSSLHVLVLRSNRFHGEVTCQKNQSWPHLQIVDIASNNFSGSLNRFNFSTWRGLMRDTVTKLNYKNLGFVADGGLFPGYYREEVTLTIKGVERKLIKIWPDFTSIDFSNNNFYEGIPDSIGELDALYLLNLSHNSLTGTIPKSFGKLRQLESLDLSMNRLTGKMPEEIAGLTLLAAMNVSHNKLLGKIPESTQIQSFPADCFEGNLGLCGLPLNISCSNSYSVPPAPQGNEEADKEIEWEYVVVAAGYAVGLGIFSWVLLFCRSFRYKYFEKIDDFFDKIFYRHQHRKRRDRRRRRAVRNKVRGL